MPRIIACFPSYVGRLPASDRSSLLLIAVLVLFLPLATFGALIVRKDALEIRGRTSQHIVEAALNVAWGYHGMARSGRMTMDEAKSATIAVIDRMYYDKTNYVYGYDYASFPGKAIVLFNRVRPDLVGQNRMDAVSPDGVKYVATAVDLAKNGGGFYRYMWNAGGTSAHARPKLSYAAAFEPWGWVIGTGSYVDDVLQQYYDNLAFIATLFAVFLFISRAILNWVCARMES